MSFMFKKGFLITFIILSVLLILLFFLFVFIFDTNSNNSEEYLELKLEGESMIPTYNDGDVLLVDQAFEELNRGDVVVFKFKTSEKFYVKRIIGISGDTVMFNKDGNILINNEIITEDYIKDVSFDVNSDLNILISQLRFYNDTIPFNNILVMGDNRKNSYDSRNFGLLSQENIIAKVISE